MKPGQRIAELYAARSILADVLMRMLAVLTVAGIAWGADTCTGAHDLRLTNGRIMTFDLKNTVASEVTIQNGRFAAMGPART